MLIPHCTHAASSHRQRCSTSGRPWEALATSCCSWRVVEDTLNTKLFILCLLAVCTAASEGPLSTTSCMSEYEVHAAQYTDQYRLGVYVLHVHNLLHA